MKRGKKQPMNAVLLFCVMLITGYGLLIGIFKHLCEVEGVQPTLNNIVEVCKLGSLITILAVGGELILNSKYHPNFLKRANKVILAISAIITVLIALKIFVYSVPILFADIEYTSYGRIFNDLLKSYGTYIAALPMMMFAFANFLSFRVDPGEFATNQKGRNAALEERSRVRKIFAVADLSAVVPILCLMVILFYPSFVFDDASEKEIFLNGALAVVILSASISRKAAEEYLT